VVAWRLIAEAPIPQAAARAIAAARARALSENPELTLIWAGGGNSPWGGWAAMALDASEDGLADLPNQFTHQAQRSELEQWAREHLDASHRAQAWNGADNIRAAARLSTPNEPAGAANEALDTRSQPPRYVIGRPR
jgi:hypothetical protein